MKYILNLRFLILRFKLEVAFHYRPQTKFAKVMFLHLSVSHSVHRGEYLGRYTPRQVHSPGRYTPLAGTPLGAVHAGRYGQQSGSTHPTGMHSGFEFKFGMCFIHKYTDGLLESFKDHWHIDQLQSKFFHFYGVFMRNLDKMVVPPPPRINLDLSLLCRIVNNSRESFS